MMTPAARLRELILSSKLLVTPAAFDPISAKLVEQAGFEAVQATGLGITATTLGLPDYSLISMADMADRTRHMASAVSIPLMADADAGFGNAVNAYYTAQAFERTGAAGLNIEDQVMPKRCGHLAGKQLVSKEEMADKIRAVREGLKDPDFVINARTDALAIEGVEGAIRRGNAYLEAGATMIYVDAIETLDQIRQIRGALDGPLGISMVEGGRTDRSITFSSLQDAGVARVSLSLTLLMASIRAMQEVLAAVRRNDGISGYEEKLLGFDELHALVGMADVRRLEKSFVTPPASGASAEGAAV